MLAVIHDDETGFIHLIGESIPYIKVEEIVDINVDDETDEVKQESDFGVVIPDDIDGGVQPIYRNQDENECNEFLASLFRLMKAGFGACVFLTIDDIVKGMEVKAEDQ